MKKNFFPYLIKEQQTYISELEQESIKTKMNQRFLNNGFSLLLYRQRSEKLQKKPWNKIISHVYARFSKPLLILSATTFVMMPIQ